MNPRPVLAIDFGTSNSYFCRALGDQPLPRGVDFAGAGRDGLASAILYRADAPPLVGQEAIEEFGDATPEERRNYRLQTRFKPDIVAREEARAAARDFFVGVLDLARRHRIDLAPQDHDVVVGVPCESDALFQQTLAEILREAGYGSIRTAPEPKGALLYHVLHRQIPASDALRGLLAVDFGGGTCDFAFLRRGQVRDAWGDLQLGGRLFDDLFYQWFLEQQPGAERQLQEEGSAYWFHASHCREAKEHFSRTMVRDRSETVRHDAGRFGRFAGLTWEEFRRRAGAYRPSALARQFGETASASDIGEARNADGSIDLLAWFRRTLENGLRERGIGAEELRGVILCGGSSQWPFVADTVREVVGIEEVRILRSDRPYVVISEGLAILPALERQFERTKETLRKELPQFMDRELAPLLDRRMQTAAEAVADVVARELFDQQIQPLLARFRDDGGTMAELRTELAAATEAFSDRLRQRVEEHLSLLTRALPGDVRQAVAAWLGRHGLAAPQDELPVETSSPADGPVRIDVPNFYKGVLETMGVVSGGLVVLLASGVVSLVLGALVAVTVGVLGPRKLQHSLESWSVPGWLRKLHLGAGSLSRLRWKCRDRTRMLLEQHIEPLRILLEDRVREQVTLEINALSEICELASDLDALPLQ